MTCMGEHDYAATIAAATWLRDKLDDQGALDIAYAFVREYVGWSEAEATAFAYGSQEAAA